jgi:ribosomal protein S18 acetylase RimI-like enzyme
MQIRPFEQSDEEAVVALWKSVFGYPQPRNDPRRVIAQKMALQRELFFVALDEGGLVGTVMGGYDGHRGWIYTLAVSPAKRRRGIGSALMERVERELIMLGCPKINLQLLASNSATVAFYQTLGYAVEERISMGKVVP